MKKAIELNWNGLKWILITFLHTSVCQISSTLYKEPSVQITRHINFSYFLALFGVRAVFTQLYSKSMLLCSVMLKTKFMNNNKIHKELTFLQ